jgi:hypothetical protein
LFATPPQPPAAQQVQEPAKPAKFYCSVGQLREALEFMGSEDEGAETPLTFAHLPARTAIDGEPMEAGLYVWLAEYPEEGCIGPLDHMPSAPPKAEGVAEVQHDSDCAMHNMPAYPNGPSDCSAAMEQVPRALLDRLAFCWVNMAWCKETSDAIEQLLAEIERIDRATLTNTQEKPHAD